jgi:hypothetical protein
MIFSDFLKFQTLFHKHLTFRLLTNNGLLKRPDFEKSSLIINQLRPNNSIDVSIYRHVGKPIKHAASKILLPIIPAIPTFPAPAPSPKFINYQSSANALLKIFSLI